MPGPSYGVPGWLSFRTDESERFIDQVEVSPSVWRAYESGIYPLPTPSIRYEIGSVLYVSPPAPGTMRAAPDPGDEQPDFQRLIDDFYARALDALRALTEPDEFIFALDCDYEGYLFWPHQAVRGEPWPLRVPGPEASDSFYAPADYSWGFYFSLYTADIFGRPLLDAFDRNKPELLSKITAVDGIAVPEPPLSEIEQKRLERQLAEDRVSQILLLTGFNYGCCPEGPWTPELDRLCAEFERSGKRSVLVRLITLIELVLDEQGIEHTPCVPLDDQDAS